MPRWFTIDTDALKAAGYGVVIDTARERAVGNIDPVDEAIANAVARVRRAVAPGNVLDADAAKVPCSLKGVAEKLAIYDLMERIGMDGSYWKDGRKELLSDLNRTADNKTKVELADEPEGAPTVAPTGMKAMALNVPRRQTGRDLQSGL